MNATKQKFVVNRKGKPVQVLIDIDDFEKMMEELEELDCIRSFDEAKKGKYKVVPFLKAIEEIENGKK